MLPKGLRPKKILAFFIILLLAVLPPLSSLIISKSYAGTFTSAKVTISDSRAEQTSVTYDFAFTTTVTTSIKQIDIKFCTQTGAFADTCTAPTGFSVSGASRTSDNLAGTGRTDSQPGANQFRTVVTTPSTQSTQAVTYSLGTVTNPTTTNTTFYARIITYSDTGTTTIDTASVAFAILTSTSIAVTASVDPTFSFSVAAVNTGTVNGASVTTGLAAAAATIPFATLVDGTPKILAHDLTVTSNAPNGYQVTVKSAAAPPLTDASQNIDAFTGTYASPTTWSAPAGTSPSVNTGFFGYTTEDTDYSGFQSNKWAGFETTARAVVSRTSPIGAGETTRLGWQAEVNENMPPGSYSGTVVLVATPTY